MAILIDDDTKLVVQGLTGREGSFHAKRNRDYGTNLVAGVTPGKGGTDVDGVPIFDTVAEAVEQTGANTSMVFVPARFAADAILESYDAGIDVIVAITENEEVKSIFINIFGGITRCDLVAEGIIDALGRLDVNVPIVVRLDGTNAEQGRKMLQDAPHPKLFAADTMLGAAERAVELAHSGGN